MRRGTYHRLRARVAAPNTAWRRGLISRWAQNVGEEHHREKLGRPASARASDDDLTASRHGVGESRLGAASARDVEREHTLSS